MEVAAAVGRVEGARGAEGSAATGVGQEAARAATGKGVVPVGRAGWEEGPGRGVERAAAEMVGTEVWEVWDWEGEAEEMGEGAGGTPGMVGRLALCGQSARHLHHDCL